jgi:PTS system mannitol-specific IIC component
MSADHTTTVIFACDAGMGSSAMGATLLRTKLKAAGITDVTVINKAVADLTSDAEFVITHSGLTDRARNMAPDAVHVTVENFMATPKYDEVVEILRAQRA